ncbi:GAF domain-containing hybrid sensor histidine kinase/response regulator [Sphingomonas jatrophae]|uniref:histidine kinase n=1 Tax=Sphingomonas jatrophae TaxID=1166337 RepID=A0A1I6KYZ2_9SPHN|nr:PAS domain-containing protein [Sphingomonas jatrophae]SFR96431.1 PAS domain S-box-containing protein [Sphingomonas jatrophae]
MANALTPTGPTGRDSATILEVIDTTASNRGSGAPSFLSNGGHCGALIGTKDWAGTTLGPCDGWPQSLKIATAILLRSHVPMVVLWSEDGIVLYNDAYSTFVGARHPALLGSNIREGWPDAAAFNDQVMRSGLAGEATSYRDQELLLHRDGRPEQVWVDLDYSPVLGEAGAPAGVICILSETTERVVAERRTAFLLSLSDAMRSLTTPAEIMALAAARLGELLGASRVFYAEIVGSLMTVEADHARGVASIVGRHSLEAFGPDLLKAYRTGMPVVVHDVPGDDRLSRAARDGLGSREVGAFVDVVLFEEEAWVGLLAVQNASPRVWTEAEQKLVQEVGVRIKPAIERAYADVRLREANGSLEAQVAERTEELRRFHDIVEATAAPICAFDCDYRLIAFNRAHNDEFRRVNGFDTRIGDIFPDLFVPDQAERMRSLMGRALAGESFTVVEAFGRPEYGTPCWKISYTPLRDAAGRVVGAFHYATDISAHLLAQSELEAAQDALRQSQKMEAMGSLTGGVAHDFNNLLTPIIGSLDMLMRKGVGTDREQRLIGGALQSAERARTLVQRLLAFARRQPLQPVAVDLGQIVGSMVDLIGSTLGPTIAMHVTVAPDLPPARADANQLEMALLNLAVNARDAMPAGGTLTIVAERCTVSADEAPGIAAGDYVCLEVSDSGTGMDEATLARAIEPFFSTKGVGQGTGLGLSMVHGLLAQLGGGLTIDSAVGRGTSIKLWFPISADDLPRVEQVRRQPRAGEAKGVVLLVEDEELVRISTADMLTDLGFEVVEARSAEEALRLMQEGLRPDLLVTDHLMPGQSGAALARRVMADRPDMPVLIVSGYAEAESIDPAIPRLTKPFRSDELAASLADLPRAATARKGSGGE